MSTQEIKDRHWMKRAEAIAHRIEPCAHARIGAILVHKNRELSRGFNRMKSHPMALKWGRNRDSIFIHAELDTILTAARSVVNWKRSTLYVCRIKRSGVNGKLIRGLAKPCEGCMGAILHYDIGRVVYSSDDPSLAYEVL